MIVKIPDFLRELREPWLEGVEPELQRHIRFNSMIYKRDNYFKLSDFLSGGGGTICEENIDEETYKSMEWLISKEYFPKEYDSNAYTCLAEFLGVRSVDLSLGISGVPVKKEKIPEVAEKYILKEAFQMTKQIYELLPGHHFGHEHFKELRLGGWGGGAAKCSEYDDPVVHMFTFAVRGARRNYAGLLLHETGHAHFASLDRETKEKINDCKTEALSSSWQDYQSFAVDYLFGSESRVSFTGTFHEFAAELYLLYVARGVQLKDKIAGLPRKDRAA